MLYIRGSMEDILTVGRFAMGYYTEVGIGCPRSLEEAKRWYGRAACKCLPRPLTEEQEANNFHPSLQLP